MNPQIVRLVLAGALVVLGVALLLVAARPDRRSLADELRVLDGRPALSGRRRRTTAVGAVITAAIVLIPLWLLALGAPALVVAAAMLLDLGIVSALVTELRLVLRGRGSAVEAPLTFRWQRRLAVRLIRELTATRPVPPLRPVMRTRPERPTAPATSRSDIRLLVVRLPADAEGLRLWDLAATYLGSTLRYRDLLALNRGRTGPGGVPITEDSVIGNGWTVLMPGDARGAGLVRLPASAGPAVVRPAHPELTHEEPRPEPMLDAGLPAGPALPAEPLPAEPLSAEPPPAEPSVAAPRATRTPPGHGDVIHRATAEIPSSAVPVGTGAISGAPPVAPEPDAGLERYEGAALAWDLVHARLLADGLLDTLDGLRERRALNRPEGAGVPSPDAVAAAVEESAHVGADRAGGAYLDLALRRLAASLAQREHPAPQIVAAHLSEDLLELRLAAPDRNPPAPFEATESGARWLLDRTVELTDVPDAAPRLPGLVSLGPDRFGRLLVNLPAGGVIALEGPTDGCRMVATAMAVELVVKRWSEAPLVNLVGFGSELAEFSPRLRYVERLSQVLDRPLRGDVVILAEPPSDAALTALRIGAGSDWFGAPAVIVIGADRRARWRLQLGPTGTLTCPELDLTVGAQALSAATAAALARLTSAERTTELPGVRSSTVLVPGLVDPDRVEVLVRLFGPPRLVRGGRDVGATSRTVELVSYLALFGCSSWADVAAALWPGGAAAAELSTALAAAAATLGTGRDGQPLLRVGAGLVGVAPEVQPDWHLFVQASAVGADIAARHLAGTSVDDPRAGLRHYGWMARLPIVRQLPGLVADVAARHDREVTEAAARRPPAGPRIVIDPSPPSAEPVLAGRER